MYLRYTKKMNEALQEGAAKAKRRPIKPEPLAEKWVKGLSEDIRYKKWQKGDEAEKEKNKGNSSNNDKQNNEKEDAERDKINNPAGPLWWWPPGC